MKKRTFFFELGKGFFFPSCSSTKKYNEIQSSHEEVLRCAEIWIFWWTQILDPPPPIAGRNPALVRWRYLLVDVSLHRFAPSTGVGCVVGYRPPPRWAGAKRIHRVLCQLHLGLYLQRCMQGFSEGNGGCQPLALMIIPQPQYTCFAFFIWEFSPIQKRMKGWFF